MKLQQYKKHPDSTCKDSKCCLSHPEIHTLTITLEHDILSIIAKTAVYANCLLCCIITSA